MPLLVPSNKPTHLFAGVVGALARLGVVARPLEGDEAAPRALRVEHLVAALDGDRVELDGAPGLRRLQDLRGHNLAWGGGAMWK